MKMLKDQHIEDRVAEIRIWAEYRSLEVLDVKIVSKGRNWMAVLKCECVRKKNPKGCGIPTLIRSPREDKKPGKSTGRKKLEIRGPGSRERQEKGMLNCVKLLM